MHPLFERYQRYWELGVLTAIFMLIATRNASTEIMDRARMDMPISAWEPFVWEYSSALSFLLLMPLIVWTARKIPLAWHWRPVLLHLLLTVPYSLLHVLLMVGMRKLAYISVGDVYDFGSWSRELVYEYQKDIVAYISIMMIGQSYEFIIRRLKGEASLVSEEADIERYQPERVLVKKLGREFVVRLEHVDRVEAAGNYVNLHIGKRLFPLRDTMAGMERRLSNLGFVRIHRSHIVNLNRILDIEPMDSGDCQVSLDNGDTIKGSRRYREALKERLSHTH